MALAPLVGGFAIAALLGGAPETAPWAQQAVQGALRVVVVLVGVVAAWANWRELHPARAGLAREAV
jgi:hypothetical protein